jgi:hypothetical protein
MPFSLEYKPLIESESSVSKTMIRPRNIYRIKSYKYADGKTKSLAGVETSIVFVIGISPEKVVSCLKITESLFETILYKITIESRATPICSFK